MNVLVRLGEIGASFSLIPLALLETSYKLTKNTVSLFDLNSYFKCLNTIYLFVRSILSEMNKQKMKKIDEKFSKLFLGAHLVRTWYINNRSVKKVRLFKVRKSRLSMRNVTQIFPQKCQTKLQKCFNSCFVMH
jgi:hypothetical protein